MSRVCVTGGSGYIGSWLVKKLLGRGCVVHATLRNLGTCHAPCVQNLASRLVVYPFVGGDSADFAMGAARSTGDETKTELLRALPGAAERLRLFQADIYDAATFEPAIAGCEFVFLVANPSPRNSKDATEAVVDATRTILQQCERSRTVRRVIHTGSVVAAAPLRDDGDGFKDFVDESCWTPLDEGSDDYVSSKTLSEKELLRHNESPVRAFEVATLLCGLVGGDTSLPSVSYSMRAMLSPLTGEEPHHSSLKFLQALVGAVPLVHVDDVCEALVFCMERPAPLAGRFLCAAGHPNLQDLAGFYARKHPELTLPTKEVVGEGVRVEAATSKLVDLGFKYRYAAEEVLDCNLECAKRMGVL
ncbi:hypothetical protein ACP70R_005419 [Stipagrostis hirtigluma subsp. patula]